MDEHIYSKSTINKFLKENLFFNDPKLEKYFERNEQRDLGKFRSRVNSKHDDKSYEKMMYVIITDSIRDIILDTIGEITEYMKNMGDLVVSGGEAYNLYTEYDEHIVTSDIDAKFVPRLPQNSKFFGKLQAIKLLLWDKLGEIAKRTNLRIKNRIMSMKEKHPKLFKFLGIGFKNQGPYVTRRYTLIKKKKIGTNNKPSPGDIFIDVELFALDLKMRFLDPKSGNIRDFTMGGILDIPFMRPNEFGYEVALTKRRGVTYRNNNSGKLITNNKILVASKEFLIEDIYLMHKLKLRPEKKEKDRQRLIKLAKIFDKRLPNTLSIDEIFGRIKSKLIKVVGTRRNIRVNANVPISKAMRVNPRKYEKFTTQPVKERLSKQIVYGLKPSMNNTKVNGYENSSGNKRLNLNTLTWKNVKNNSYVKNEYKLRPVNGKALPKNLNTKNVLYGYNPVRNAWVPGQILEKAANIPFVGLKK